MRVAYRCVGCQRAEDLNPPAADWAGTHDDRARARGWRLAPADSTGARVAVCPVCSGSNPNYWDTHTLTMAAVAGIAAGTLRTGGATRA